MRFVTVLLIALLATPANATVVPWWYCFVPAAPKAPPPPPPAATGGTSAAGAWAVGGFIAGVGILAVWCRANQPKRDRSHDTWVDTRSDAKPSYSPYPYDGCLIKRDPPIATRG